LILSGLHLSIGCFIAGYFYREQLGAETLREKLVLYISSIFFCLFGVEFYVSAIIYGLVVQLLRFIGRTTQIPFYWRFYLTKKYSSLTEEQLKNIDHFRERVLTEILTDRKVSLVIRHTLYTISLVYKRYNHKFKTIKQWKKEQTERELEEYNKQEIGNYYKAYLGKGPVPWESESEIPRCNCGAVIPHISVKKYQSCYQCGEEFVPTRCQASRDGECYHSKCPQILENEPEKSGRSCPLIQDDDGD